jgi:perosamine synthetase
MFLPPKSRFRIQSYFSAYIKLLFATIFNRLESGNKNLELEKEMASFLNVENVFTVNQARVGVYLAVKAVIQGEKNEIILSPYTIFDVVNMVLCAGGKPVFVDIDKNSCNIDPKLIKECITDQTAAVMATHLHGLSCDMRSISKICKKNDLYLIEDSAQAFGVQYDKKMLGTIGDIGVYSFGLFKTVNSFFGGAVVSDNKELMEKMKSYSSNFIPNSRSKILKRIIQSFIFDIAANPVIFKTITYWIFRYGYLTGNPYLNKLTQSENNPVLKIELPNDYKNVMSNVQASIVLNQLRSINEKMRIRQEIAYVYYEGLKDEDNITIPDGSPDINNGCLQYPIQVEDRHSMLVKLMKIGRDCAPQHIRNCADLEIYKDYYKDCPIARKTSKSVIILPTYTQYGINEAKKNVAVLTNI